MTTKPRASKFRIKRSGKVSNGENEAAKPAGETQGHLGVAPSRSAPRPISREPNETNSGRAEAEQRLDPAQTRIRDKIRAAQQAHMKDAPQAPDRGATAQHGGAKSAPRTNPKTSIDEIRREGLTGRQLRMARRVAQKNGIGATSDFEAVKLLREAGIDPFQAAGALELVVPNTADTSTALVDKVQLPQTVPGSGSSLTPSVQPAAETRAKEIRAIQQDIARRRRKKMTLLFARLAIFVGLPTLAFGYYFAFLATPMFSTKSAFLIQQNEGAGSAAGGLAGMFGSNQLATVQDSIAVQGYLKSREAMLRLNEDHGFKAHFQRPEIDAISRLAADASNEEAYKVYGRNVKIGYDPTEGIITMEVIAASPEASQTFSNALISYAEGQVSDLSLRLRNDQMSGARASFSEAEQKREEAAQRLVALQTELQTVDATGVIASAEARIATFETQLEERRIELQAQLANRRPNQARVEGLEADIRFLEQSVATQRARLTEVGEEGNSLASIQAQIQMAQIDFTTRDAMLQQALQALESSRISADRQVRYIAISTPPTAPDTATYPKVFENTFLAFLIFAGIYLMVSLTASILREQVSS
ncbi:MAG: capsule biosynthesis protein [Pseudomonadota bacterium]